MLVCRYMDNDGEGGRSGYGRLVRGADGDTVVPVRYDRAVGRWVDAAGRARPLDGLTLLPPAEPSKIACVALNRAPDGRPVGRPVGRDRPPAGASSTAVVLKPPSSLAGSGDTVHHPGPEWELRYEAELAVVIGVRCTRVTPDRAAAVVAGYTCANDLTAYARPAADAPAPAGVPPVWAKHFDGFTPLGPWLAADLDPDDVEITCAVDGRTVERASTRGLLTPVHRVIAAVSAHMTLLPGDVILTGTPAGSGPLPVGSRVEVAVADIGTLTTTIGTPHERQRER